LKKFLNKRWDIMEAETINQAYTFIVFIINGLLIGILFDIFRILRKSFKTSDLITYIQDILFWILTGIILLYSIFVFNNGNVRIYIFIAIGCGVLIYMLLFSKLIINVCVNTISIIKNILRKLKDIIFYPINLIYKAIKKIFLRPIAFIFINFKKITSKKNYLCSKIVKNTLFFRKKEGKKL